MKRETPTKLRINNERNDNINIHMAWTDWLSKTPLSSTLRTSVHAHSFTYSLAILINDSNTHITAHVQQKLNRYYCCKVWWLFMPDNDKSVCLVCIRTVFNLHTVDFQWSNEDIVVVITQFFYYHIAQTFVLFLSSTPYLQMHTLRISKSDVFSNTHRLLLDGRPITPECIINALTWVQNDSKSEIKETREESRARHRVDINMNQFHTIHSSFIHYYEQQRS